MTAIFLAADIGRDIVGGGGVATITGYTNPQTVTATILQPFPAGVFDTGTWAISGSPQATITPAAKGPVGATTTLTLSAAGWRAEDVGKYVRVNGGLLRITSFAASPNNTTVANATILIEMLAIVGAPALAWTLEGAMWGGVYGYPRCGTLHEQRLWLAGSVGFPQGMWGSAIGAFLDITTSTLDDDGIAYIIAGGETAPILHLITVDGLVALTTSGMFSIQGGNDSAITPTNIRVREASAIGCSQPPPAKVGSEAYVIQRGRRKVRAVSLNQYTDGQYVAPDQSALSEHVTESGVVSMAYQAEPGSMLFAVRADGQIAVLTCERDQDVFGWTRQVTQGSFENVEVVQTQDGASVFVVVARTVNGSTTRHIEKLDADMYVDAGITGSTGVAALVWGGLTHLQGMTVQAKGDGTYLGEFVVSAIGQITLPRTARTVEIGLPFTTKVKTLTPEFMGPTGSSQGHQLSITEARVRLLKTTGCTVNLQDVALRALGLGVLDKPPPLFTGIKSVGNLGWGDGVAQTLVQQALPYPFHLLSVVTKLAANEG